MQESSDINSTVNGYTIFQLLGRGHFGRVYKASKHDQLFAIKVIKKSDLNPSRNHRTNPRDLLNTQIAIMQKIQSDYVVRLEEHFQTQTRVYLVEEYCEGGTLQQMIEKEVSVADGVAIIQQVIHGITAMHNISVIHRDLKPENILRKGGSYKIGDLGFARILQFGDVTRLQVGTINFMAPEIIAGNPYNMKVDIWSLGVIFYRMIFGKLPFQFKTIGAGALINTMRNTVLDFDSRKVSKDVKSFIEGCLKVTPGERFDWADVLKHPLFRRKRLHLTNTTIYEPGISNIEIPLQIKQDLFANFNQSSSSSLQLPVPTITTPKVPQAVKTPNLQRTLSIHTTIQDIETTNLTNFKILKTQLNKIMLLVEYLIKANDEHSKKTMLNSKKLTELRLAVAHGCVRKIQQINHVVEQEKNIFRLSNFEEFVKSTLFFQLRNTNRRAYQQLKSIQQQLTRTLSQLDNKPLNRLRYWLCVPNSGHEYVRRISTHKPRQPHNFQQDQHADVVEDLGQRVLHKFRNFQQLPASSSSFFRILLLIRYRKLTSSIVNTPEHMKQIEELIERILYVEHIDYDWQEVINQLIESVQ